MSILEQTTRQLGAAAEHLARRLLGSHASHLLFESLPDEGSFEWEPRGATVVLRGGSPVDQARALHDYLSEACDGAFGWSGPRLTLPPRNVQQGLRHRRSPFQYRHYLNQVTFAYSMPWWNWARWEREIDWMALHGINLPLVAIGQEAAWRQTWRDVGVCCETLDKYWTGAAYLPFHRMGCIDGHGGPLPRRWIDRQAELARKVLERMRSYGMTPVLSAFAGHVPEQLRSIAPASNITRLEPWAEFPQGTCYLQPTDPLFTEIQRRFLTHQRELFGTDHYYAADPFIEMPPVSSDPGELAALARGILSSMTQVDPAAHWVLQAWPFEFMKEFWGAEQVRAFIEGVEGDRLVLLDLACDHVELWRLNQSFYGKPWLWCTAEIFGARAGSAMYGRLDRLAAQPHAALQSPDRQHLAGIGLVWESVDENDVLASLFAERAWSDEQIDLDQWLTQWVRRRYGREQGDAEAAWQALRQTLYNAPVENLTCPYPLVCVRPDRVQGKPTTHWYAPEQVVNAAQRLFSAAGDLGESDAYRHDLVLVVMRALLDAGDQHVRGLLGAAEKGDGEGVQRHGDRVLEVIDAAERLARTREAMLLGRWIGEARAWGEDAAEQNILELNARMLVTIWGGPILADYACKAWAGLFQSFYRYRWSRCLEAATAACSRRVPLDQKRLGSELAAWEQAWVRTTDPTITEAEGDEVQIAGEILELIVRLGAESPA